MHDGTSVILLGTLRRYQWKRHALRMSVCMLKNMSDRKVRDVGWVGRVGKDYLINNLGRGRVEFF